MRLVPKKRPAALVGVAERLAAAAAAAGRPPARVVVCGDGPARAGVERLARRRGVADVIEFVGWRPREWLRALYAGADCFVLPTEREAFGISALEARAAGLPVVARRGTGVEDFVEHGREGLLAGSDDELAEAAARLAVDGALRARIAERCRVPPTAFDWPAVIALHEAAYAEAARA
jgi:glycosyltransferase involved in cell wall biosynthesis